MSSQKLSLVGQIAIANMACIGSCALIDLWMFPTGIRRVGVDPNWMLIVDSILGWISVVLVFPLGWIMEWVFNPGIHATLSPLILVYVPANAYIWGYLIDRFVKGRSADQTREQAGGS